MNEHDAKAASPGGKSTRYTPDGYRSGLITAIPVPAGFSLSFLRDWAFEARRSGRGVSAFPPC